jgi:hypothetical protein
MFSVFHLKLSCDISCMLFSSVKIINNWVYRNVIPSTAAVYHSCLNSSYDYPRTIVVLSFLA